MIPSTQFFSLLLLCYLISIVLCCSESSDCSPSDQICVDGKCRERVKWTGPQIFPGSLSWWCNEDTDCASGMNCAHNLCIEQMEKRSDRSRACIDSSACPHFYECRNYECVPKLRPFQTRLSSPLNGGSQWQLRPQPKVYFMTPRPRGDVLEIFNTVSDPRRFNSVAKRASSVIGPTIIDRSEDIDQLEEFMEGLRPKRGFLVFQLPRLLRSSSLPSSQSETSKRNRFPFRKPQIIRGFRPRNDVLDFFNNAVTFHSPHV